MKQKKWAALFAVVLCATALSLPGQVALASQENENRDLDANVESTQAMFQEKRTVPAWLLTDLAKMDNKTITLNADFYAVSFNSETVGEVPWDAVRYDLTVNRLTKNIQAFENAVGAFTPKYVLEVVTPTFPGTVTITLTDSSFMPTSEVCVYRYVDDLTFEIVDKNAVVDENGNVSFPITQGGKYLVSSRGISEKLEQFDFERPALTNGGELLTYLNQDSRYDFSDLYRSRGLKV